MIQAVMYFVLGLLAAGLLALALTPAVWRRAHRLARARVESSLPMSLGEVQAEKDQLRASFAMSARRLELEVADLKEKTAAQTIAASRYKTEIATLVAAQNEKAAAIAELEAGLAAAREAVTAAEARVEAARAEVASRDASLAQRSERVAALEAELAALQLVSEEQRLELVARDTAIGNLQDQVAAARAAEAKVAETRDEIAAALAAETAAFAAERVRGEGLSAQIEALGVERRDRLAALEGRAADLAAVEAELAAARTERDALAATVAALEADRTERLAEIARLRAGDMSGREAAAHEGGDNMRKALESIEAEKSGLEARLAALESDYAVLVADHAALKETAAAESGAADTALRGQLSEIAANVLRLTRAAADDGEAAASHAQNGGNGAEAHRDTARAEDEAVAPPEGEPEPETLQTSPGQGRSLAERIRALQHAARH
ncbi:MAG: hypothetical protein KDK07_01170 [Bauldia sp.]|nr:hypothetical protein [Bauldia sp.]